MQATIHFVFRDQSNSSCGREETILVTSGHPGVSYPPRPPRKLDRDVPVPEPHFEGIPTSDSSVTRVPEEGRSREGGRVPPDRVSYTLGTPFHCSEEEAVVPGRAHPGGFEHDLCSESSLGRVET